MKMQKTPLAGLFFPHCAHQRSSLSQLIALFAMQEKYRSLSQAHERKSSRIEAKAREKMNLVIDIGTTNIIFFDGQRKTLFRNPQYRFGSDIMSRILHAMQK